MNLPMFSGRTSNEEEHNCRYCSRSHGILRVTAYYGQTKRAITNCGAFLDPPGINSVAVSEPPLLYAGVIIIDQALPFVVVIIDIRGPL